VQGRQIVLEAFFLEASGDFEAGLDEENAHTADAAAVVSRAPQPSRKRPVGRAYPTRM
jgi:hypothetical protein